VETYRRASIQFDVAHAYADEFGHSSAGVTESREHHAIALAAPRVGVGCIEQGAYFISGEEAYQRAFVTLHRDCEHLLNRAKRLRDSGRSIVEKRANGGKSQVATADAVVANYFEVFEELEDQRGVKIAEFQALRWTVQTLFGKSEKQPHSIAVSCHRSWASVTLLHQALQKELLQQLRKRRR
jgi:hypothetical protein